MVILHDQYPPVNSLINQQTSNIGVSAPYLSVIILIFSLMLSGWFQHPGSGKSVPSKIVYSTSTNPSSSNNTTPSSLAFFSIASVNPFLLKRQ